MNNFSHAKPGVLLYNIYMGNKPDNFGIKFWLLADAQSKYLSNGKPYLGRDLAEADVVTLQVMCA